MKKVILFFSVLFLGATLAFGQTATLSIEELGGGIPAGTVTTAITLDDVDVAGENIGTFQIFVLYDPTVLQPVPGSEFYPSPFFQFFEWANNLDTGGEIALTWLSFFGGVTPPPGEVLVTIDWIYTGDPDRSDLVFNTSKDALPGWPEKGATLMWSTIGTPFGLTLVDGGVGPTGPLVNEWTGAFDDNWFDILNWSLGVVPTTEDVLVPVTAKGNPVIFGGSATTGALTVMPGAGLTIDVGADLTTGGLFTCDGDFEILTDLAGFSGSFIDLGGLAGAGMFYMDRHVTCFGTGDPNNPVEPIGWHYISAPIDGYSTDDMLDFYVNQWDESVGMFMNYAGTDYCIPYAPAEFLDGMEVWSVKFDQIWPYNGYPGGPCPQPVNGPVIMYNGPFTALHTGPYSSGATVGAGAGWNMHANPYPSGLDLNAIVWDPGAVPGAALYDACPGSYGYWSPAVGAYSMPVGNGFFTEWTAPGTFSLTGAERAHGPDFYYKEEITELLILEAIGQGAPDKLYVRFMEEAEAGFAKDGDFHKLFTATEELPQVYTTAGEDKLAINALPATSVVPMGFTSVTSGEYTISAIETTNFTEVYLKDLVTGAVTDLMTDSYTFSYTTGDDEARFEIHFGALGIDDNLINQVSIWSNENNVYVNVPKELKGTITVYTMMGQEVISTDTQPGQNVIPMDEINTYYVVKVISNDRAVTGKVYIK